MDSLKMGYPLCKRELFKPQGTLDETPTALLFKEYDNKDSVPTNSMHWRARPEFFSVGPAKPISLALKQVSWSMQGGKRKAAIKFSMDINPHHSPKKRRTSTCIFFAVAFSGDWALRVNACACVKTVFSRSTLRTASS